MGSPNVFIGSGSGGGGGGGSGSVSGATDGIFPVSVDPSSISADEGESHYVDITFKDAEEMLDIGPGYELTDTDARISRGRLSGTVHKSLVSSGQCDIELRDIALVRWSLKGALKAGETAKLQIETLGMKDGVRVVFHIWERNTDKPDERIKTLEAKLSGNKAEASWVIAPNNYPGDGLVPAEAAAGSGRCYSIPDYYFEARIDPLVKRSGILTSQNEVDVFLRCEHGEAFGNVPYIAFLSTGEVRQGKVGGDGRFKIDNLPDKNIRIEISGLEEKIRKCQSGIHDTSDPSSASASSAPGVGGSACPGEVGASPPIASSPCSSDRSVHDLMWSKPSVKWDEPVSMSAKTTDIPDGASAILTIYQFGDNNAHRTISQVNAAVEGSAVQAPWTFEYANHSDLIPTRCELSDHGPPQFFFTVKAGGAEHGLGQESKLLLLELNQTDKVSVLEFEDVLFHVDSAALMPNGRPNPERPEQNNIVGLDVLLTIYRYLNFGPYKDKKLMIAGHTDSSADNEHNMILSKTRAKSIHYLLMGTPAYRKPWVDAVESRRDIQKDPYRDEDIRRVLKWVNSISGNYSADGLPWNCDPGREDGAPVDEPMRDAIENFRAGYNRWFPGPYADSQMGPRYWGWAKLGDDPGWGAVYDIYQAELKRRYTNGNIDASRALAAAAFSWGSVSSDPSSPYAVVGCGEERPLDKTADDDTITGRQCQTNRRVEIMFLDPEEVAQLGAIPCHDNNCYKSICGSDQCPLWGKNNGILRFEMEYLKPGVDFGTAKIYVEIGTCNGTCSAAGITHNFRLHSIDAGLSYDKTIPGSDGQVIDNHLYLTFKETPTALYYSFELITQTGERYYVLENKHYTEIKEG